MASFAAASDGDLSTQVATERMLAGISVRRYRRPNEPVGQHVEQAAIEELKSAVSRRFIRGTQRALD